MYVIFYRYLDRYEKINFLGETGSIAGDDDEDSRHKKWSARALHSVPLVYNHHQHTVNGMYIEIPTLKFKIFSVIVKCCLMFMYVYVFF